MPEVSPNLATLGPTGWVPSSSWAAQAAVPVNAPAALWANRANFQSVGNIVRFTDVGGGQLNTGGGTLWVYTGVRWKPLNGECLLDSIDTRNTTAGASAQTQLNGNHNLIQRQVIRDFDRFMVWLAMSKAGTVSAATVRIHLGAAGTIADTVIATVTTLAGANQSFGGTLEFKRLSATSVQRQGNADPAAGYTGANAGAYQAAVTLASSLDTVDQYLSISSQLDAGTEDVAVENYTMRLLATDS